MKMESHSIDGVDFQGGFNLWQEQQESEFRVLKK